MNQSKTNMIAAILSYSNLPSGKYLVTFSNGGTTTLEFVQSNGHWISTSGTSEEVGYLDIAFNKKINLVQQMNDGLKKESYNQQIENAIYKACYAYGFC